MFYRFDELVVVSTRQIGSADCAAEQAVAGKDLSLFFLGQHHVATRMTWTMADRKPELADIVDFAVFPASSQFWRLFVIEAELFHLIRRDAHKNRLLRQCVIKVLVVLVQENFGFG